MHEAANSSFDWLPALDPPRVFIPLGAAKVSAGFPSPAADYEDKRLDINEYLIRNPVSTFFFPVQGDSMQGAGIFDGDYALIKKVDSAREGEIIVALVEDHEATLKYFRREGAMVRLDPANRAYEPQRYKPGQVRIQGKLAGLLRRY